MGIYGELLNFDIKGLHNIPLYGFLRLYAESPRWPLIDGDGDANKQKFAPERVPRVISHRFCHVCASDADSRCYILRIAAPWKPRRRTDEDGL